MTTSIDRGKACSRTRCKAFEVHAISLGASQRLALPPLADEQHIRCASHMVHERLGHEQTLVNRERAVGNLYIDGGTCSKARISSRLKYSARSTSLPSGLGSPLRGRSKSTMYKLLPTSGSQRLRSPRIPSTSAVTPASSTTSRITACSTVSSGSKIPLAPASCRGHAARRVARARVVPRVRRHRPHRHYILCCTVLVVA